MSALPEDAVDFSSRMTLSRKEVLDSLSWDPITEYVSKFTNSCFCVLEGGSGLGRYVHFLKTKGVPVVGVEISRHIVLRSKCYFPTCEFVNADVRHLPFKDHTFGMYLSLGVIEHFRTPSQVMLEMKRVLKLGGFVVITVPNAFSFWPFVRKWLSKRDLWDIGSEKSYFPQHLRLLMASFGFEVKELREILALSSLLRLFLFVLGILKGCRRGIKPLVLSSHMRIFPQRISFPRIFALLVKALDSFPILRKCGFLLLAVGESKDML